MVVAATGMRLAGPRLGARLSWWHLRRVKDRIRRWLLAPISRVSVLGSLVDVAAGVAGTAGAGGAEAGTAGKDNLICSSTIVSNSTSEWSPLPVSASRQAWRSASVHVSRFMHSPMRRSLSDGPCRPRSPKEIGVGYPPELVTRVLSSAFAVQVMMFARNLAPRS